MCPVVLQFIIIVLLFHTLMSTDLPAMPDSEGTRGDYSITVIAYYRNVQTDLLYENITNYYYFDEGIRLSLNCHRNSQSNLEWSVGFKDTTPIQPKKIKGQDYFIEIRNVNRYFNGLVLDCSTNYYNSPKTLVLRYSGSSISKPQDTVLNYDVGDSVLQPCGGKFETYDRNATYFYSYLAESGNKPPHKYNDVSKSGIVFNNIGMNDNETTILCTTFKSLGKKYQKHIRNNAETCEMEIRRVILTVNPRTNDTIVKSNANDTIVKYNANDTIVKYNPNDTIVKYNTNNDTTVPGDMIEKNTSFEQTSGDTTEPILESPVVIGLIAGVITLMTIFVVYKLIKMWRKNRMLETHIYAEPSQVVYAQIQLDNTNNAPLPLPNSNKEPYARIVGVLYPTKAYNNTPLTLPPRNRIRSDT